MLKLYKCIVKIMKKNDSFLFHLSIPSMSLNFISFRIFIFIYVKLWIKLCISFISLHKSLTICITYVYLYIHRLSNNSWFMNVNNRFNEGMKVNSCYMELRTPGIYRYRGLPTSLVRPRLTRPLYFHWSTPAAS